MHCFERVTGRKARGLQMEEIGCKCQTFFLSLLSGRRKQISVKFFPIYVQNSFGGPVLDKKANLMVPLLPSATILLSPLTQAECATIRASL